MPISKNIADLMRDVRKKHGDHSMSMASDIRKFDSIPSGSLCLDYITEIGGLPSNRVVEYVGDPGSGKSTLAMHTMNNALKFYPDRYALFIDLEQKLTADWMANFVDDLDRVLVINPEHIEQATDRYKDFVRSGEICCVVLDSIGGAPTKRTSEKSAEIASFGGNSIGVGEFARNAATLGGKYNCLTVGINQIRADMEGFRRLTSPGGMAWKHACVLRVHTKRGADKYIERQDNGEDIQVGYDVVIKTVKSGVGTPFRASKYRFYSTRSRTGAFGVDRADEVIRMGRLSGVIEKRGGWYYHPELPEGGKIQGEPNLIDYAAETPGFVDVVEQGVRVKMSKGEAIAGISTTFDEEYAERDDNGYIARKLAAEEEAATSDGGESPQE